MEFSKLLEIVKNEPVFETSLLLAGDVDPANVRKQISRWTAAGKLIQLRRGLYCVAEPYQKAKPHPFLVANRLRPNSYISLQSALAYHGMIPEAVFMTTSVTTSRPESFASPLGAFDFRHIQPGWFHGYRRVDLGNEQSAFAAWPEKAILDLVYLRPGGDADDYLRSLRLQALDQLDLVRLIDLAESSGKPKLLRAAITLQILAEEESEGFDL